MPVVSKFDQLKEWVISNGGYIHSGIGIDETNVDNRVLIAKEDISNQVMIFEIPKHLCLFKNDELQVNPNFENFERQIHLVSLLKREFELGTKSFHYPYLNFLPSINEFKTHPVYIAVKNPNKITEWKKICVFSGSVSIAITSLKFIKLYFDKILKIEISDDELLYYYLLIITRSWGDGGFVPFADLFQSRQNSMMFLDTNQEENKHKLFVDRTYKPNDVIWINYGLFDDSLTYSNFGFIDDIDNRESIPRSIRVTLAKEGNQTGTLKDFVKRELSSKYKANNIFFSSLGISKAIFEYLRIINLTEQEYELLSKTDIEQGIYMKKIISIENEFKVYQNLFSIIFSSNFPTKEMVELSKDIIKQNRFDNEYYFAKLTMIQKDIFKNTFSSLIKTWTGSIGVPSSILFTFQNHHLLDD
jgi:hypothetical protein